MRYNAGTLSLSFEAAVRPTPGNGGMGTEIDGMNTLQLIKARATRTRALELARKQMAKAFGVTPHTDATHTDVTTAQVKTLTYRGVAYTPSKGNRTATAGRELRYRGVRYGMY